MTKSSTWPSPRTCSTAYVSDSLTPDSIFAYNKNFLTSHKSVEPFSAGAVKNKNFSLSPQKMRGHASRQSSDKKSRKRGAGLDKAVLMRISYRDIFDRIIDIWGERAEEKLRIVNIEWRLRPPDDENVLRDLLELRQDTVAT